jgi:hypothetical protein
VPTGTFFIRIEPGGAAVSAEVFRERAIVDGTCLVARSDADVAEALRLKSLDTSCRSSWSPLFGSILDPDLLVDLPWLWFKDALLPVLNLVSLKALGPGAGVTYSRDGVCSLVRVMCAIDPATLAVRVMELGFCPTCTILGDEMPKSLLLPSFWEGDGFLTIFNSGALLGVSVPYVSLPSLVYVADMLRRNTSPRGGSFLSFKIGDAWPNGSFSSIALVNALNFMGCGDSSSEESPTSIRWIIGASAAKPWWLPKTDSGELRRKCGLSA